jgi:uncharacterized phage protein (TIGR02220 family)
MGLWFYWLSQFVDEIFEPDFVEKQEKMYPKVREIRDAYVVGIQLLRQHDFKIISPKKKRTNKILTKEQRKQGEEILTYLNEKAGTNFSTKGGSNLELIVACLERGFSIEDCKTVIDKKVTDWKGTDYAKYLRPITLFGKSKFENYLNQLNEQPINKFSKLSDSVAKAQQLIKFYKQ